MHAGIRPLAASWTIGMLALAPAAITCRTSAGPDPECDVAPSVLGVNLQAGGGGIFSVEVLTGEAEMIWETADLPVETGVPNGLGVDAAACLAYYTSFTPPAELYELA